MNDSINILTVCRHRLLLESSMPSSFIGSKQKTVGIQMPFILSYAKAILFLKDNEQQMETR